MAGHGTARRPGRKPAPAGVAALVVGLLLLGTAASQSPSHHEDVQVTRAVFEVRVAGKLGEPLLGLGPEDFRVRIGGKLARVESVDWIGGMPVTTKTTPLSQEVTGMDVELPPRPGRLIVLVFQRDLQILRIVGLAKIMRSTQEMIRGLAPNDRVAVLTYRKQLKIYSDFTTDHDRILEILEDSIVFHRPPPALEPSPSPSLLEHLDLQDAKGAATPEDALVLIGDALRELPGSKSLIFYCWGIGRMVGDAIIMEHNYPEALESLTEGQTTVFSIDLTQADYHSLEGPLIRLAKDTGGFYAKTLYVPQMAVAQVADALSGHYLLTVENPDLELGHRRLSVRLTEKEGVVYAREYIEITN